MAWWMAMLLAFELRDLPRPPQPISGANLADECQFPTVVSLRGADNLCTGSLVHPRVVVTAAHCIAAGPPVNIHFGEAHTPDEHSIGVERCEVYPQSIGNGSPTYDIAYCVLETAVEGAPTIPLLAGCEVDAVVEGGVAVMVGYGRTVDPESLFGRKRYAFTSLASGIRADGTVLVGDDGANGCLGDSGGPALVQLADGTWRALGVLSRGPDCGKGPGTYRSLADRIEWLEQGSGFDLTPCFDDDGQWEPGPACVGFDDDPRVTTSGWDVYCDGPRITPAMTCMSDVAEGSSSDEGTSSGVADESSSGGGAPEREPPESGCGCDQRGGATPLIAFVLFGRRRPTRAARR